MDTDYRAALSDILGVLDFVRAGDGSLPLGADAKIARAKSLALANGRGV